jgi:cytochrome P450
MSGEPAVRDFSTDYDIFDPGYVTEPYPVWDELRRSCPVAHSDRYGASWLPTRYDDVASIAHDVEHFSSRSVSVVAPPDDEEGALPLGLPPISSDPPVHTWSRRLLLPWFSHQRVAQYEPLTRELCQQLTAVIVERGHGDAAEGYAQHIPARVIAGMLGVPADFADTFTGWVRDVLEFAHDEERRRRGRIGILTYLTGEIEARRTNPGDDLISGLLHAEVDGEPLPDAHVLGTAALTLIAGVDTTWSSIGSSLWHLATHPADRKRLVTEPELIPTAIEELLRAYSPVTMARIVVEDVEFAGCPMKAGDRVLLSFPAANRDPDAFPDADTVIIDREQNRHAAFGLGIHRCAGSNLARMELRVAIEEWLAAIPEFRLQDGVGVTWAGGQVRGPRTIPVVVG